jgi:hypothetical protein
VVGPFTESKEIVGGYELIEARSKEHALEIAREFMEIHRVHWPEFEGESEVRPPLHLRRHLGGASGQLGGAPLAGASNVLGLSSWSAAGCWPVTRIVVARR